MVEKAQPPMKTIIGKVQYVSILANNRYGISFGHSGPDGKLIWYNGFGKCPVSKGEDVEMSYVETPEGFRNIKQIRVIKFVPQPKSIKEAQPKESIQPPAYPEPAEITEVQPERVAERAETGRIEQPLQGEAQPLEFKHAAEMSPLQERASIVDLIATVKDLENQIASLYSMLSKEYEKIDGLIESVALLRNDLRKIKNSKSINQR